jgi:hypothetical protein
MMSTTKDQVRSSEEALDLALEALEVANSLIDGYYLPKEKAWLPEIEAAITAIKQARSAHYVATPLVQEPIISNVGADANMLWPDTMYGLLPKGTGKITLHESKPRTWVGLTDEQIDLFINGRGDEDDDDYVEPTGDGFGITDADLVKLVRRAEAKLKEKNSD